VKEPNPDTQERSTIKIDQSKQLISEAQPNTGLQGDCAEAMRQLRIGSIDLVLTIHRNSLITARATVGKLATMLMALG
jgi:hypothetical protein